MPLHLQNHQLQPSPAGGEREYDDELNQSQCIVFHERATRLPQGAVAALEPFEQIDQPGDSILHSRPTGALA